MHRRSFMLSACAAAGLAAAQFAAAPAGAAADFAGKRIEIMVPTPPGGGTDTWARFLLPYLQEHLPGKPTVVVNNVPGGGQITGCNQFEQRARPDGLQVFASSGSIHFAYLLGDRRVRCKMEDWIAVLGSPTGGVVHLRPDLGVSNLSQLATLRGRAMKYGSQGHTSLDLLPVLSFEMLGLNVEPVLGMQGRGPARLAFERGELQIDYQTTSAYIRSVRPLVQAGRSVELFAWGALDGNGNVVRDPTFPNLPSFLEVYRQMNGRDPSGPQWDAWRSFFSAGYGVQKYLLLPARTPRDIVDAWNNAIRATVTNAEFRQKAAAEIGDYTQFVGAEADRQFSSMIKPPASAKQYILDWLKRRFNVTP